MTGSILKMYFFNATCQHRVLKKLEALLYLAFISFRYICEKANITVIS